MRAMRGLRVGAGALAAVIALAAVACGGEDSAADGRVVVATGAYPLTFLAEEIGGAEVVVRPITAPGVDAHDAELTADQLDTLASADLVFYLGDGFHPGIEEAAERADARAVDATRGLAGGDPHVWLDPRRFAQVADRVAEALAEVDGERAAVYEENAEQLRRRLLSLDAEFEEGLASCERDLFVTSHAAFGHLARRYRLVEESIAGTSPEAEPDPKRLAELAALVEREGVTTVFAEAGAPDDVVEALARESGARTAVLHTVETRTEEQADAGVGYFELMRENLAALRAALECT